MNHHVCNSYMYNPHNYLGPQGSRLVEMKNGEVSEKFRRRDILGWSDGDGAGFWEFNLRSGLESADVGGGKPVAVVSPVRRSGKGTPLFGIRLMLIKTKL